MVELKRQILHASFVPAARNRGTVVPIPEALFDLAYHGGSDPKDVRNWLLPWIGCKRDEMWNDPYSFFCFIPFDLRVRDVEHTIRAAACRGADLCFRSLAFIGLDLDLQLRPPARR